MSIGNVQAIRDWINTNYYDKNAIIDSFCQEYNFILQAGGSESVIVTEDSALGRSWNFTTNTGGNLSNVKLKLIPGTTLTLRGSVSNQTFTQQVGLDAGTTQTLYCMPKGSMFWYGNICAWNIAQISTVTSGTSNLQSIDGSSNYNICGGREVGSQALKMGFGFTNQSINCDKTNISQYSGTCKYYRSAAAPINNFTNWKFTYTPHKNKANNGLKVQIIFDPNMYVFNVLDNSTSIITENKTTAYSGFGNKPTGTVINTLIAKPYPSAIPQIWVESTLQNSESATDDVKNYIDIHEFYLY